MHRARALEGFLPDLRVSLRLLRLSPGFATACILTLAVSIGATVALGSAFKAIYLDRLPYEDPERLVMIWGTSQAEGDARGQVSFTDAEDWRAQSRAFDGLAAFTSWRPILSGDGPAERVSAAQVSEDFFRVMGTDAGEGRLFLPEEQLDGRDRVAVLSHGFWLRRFGGDRSVIGRSIRLNLVPYTVVGVLPAGFTSLPARILAAPADLYRPLAEQADELMRSARHLRAIARLKEGTTLEQARSEMDLISERLARAHPDSNAGQGARPVQLRDEMIGGLRPALWVLLGAVGLVLLIACANVSILLLSRASVRHREMAIRTALGAGRARLVRQLLTESLVLGLSGGLLGLLLAVGGVSWLQGLGPRVHPALEQVRVDSDLLSIALGVTLAAVLLFGLTPAWRLSGHAAAAGVRPGSPRSGGARARLFDTGGLLVAAETALALVLVVGSVLMVRTMVHLERVHPGFVAAGKLKMDLWLPWKRYHEPDTQTAFFQELERRVSTLPGVRAAGVTSIMPLVPSHDRVSIDVEGRDYEPGLRPSPDRYVVSSGYLAAMPIRVLAGRWLDERDLMDSAPVVLVSRTLARSIWPGEPAVGRRIRLPAAGGGWQPWREVVGVVEDVRQYGLDRDATMQIYLPHTQFPWAYMTLVVEGEGGLRQLTARLRGTVAELDPDIPVFDVDTLSGVVAASTSVRRFSMQLVTLFALVALVLVALGLSGVMLFWVARRLPELGIRMALGAPPPLLWQGIVRQGVGLTLAGVAIGLPLAWLAVRSLTRLLFEISPTDPATLIGVATLLIGIGFLACLIPARQAARVDPLAVLRRD